VHIWNPIYELNITYLPILIICQIIVAFFWSYNDTIIKFYAIEFIILTVFTGNEAIANLNSGKVAIYINIGALLISIVVTVGRAASSQNSGQERCD
jgi:hypothetical protein